MITLTLYKSGNELYMRKWKEEYENDSRKVGGRKESGFPFSDHGLWKYSLPLPAFSINQRYVLPYVRECVCVCARMSECLLFWTACKYCSCLKWKLKAEIFFFFLQIYCIKDTVLTVDKTLRK